MTSLVGKSLQNGKYSLIEEIGRDISSTTYKAINQVSHQLVLIKTLKIALAQEEYLAELRKKFLDEAKRLVKCTHPNIIPFREYFTENELPYIVMDFIPGQTLDKVVSSTNLLSETTAIYYIRQIGEALKVVHKNGLLHRDIKPHNIILRENTQQVVLVEFGIAREFLPGEVKTHTTIISEYAPLEQYLPKAKRTQASDVYGLAATLYTLLTAEVPVSAMLRTEPSSPVPKKISLPSPKTIRPELSDMVSDAVMQGMALRPEKRPGTVEQWLSLLPRVNTRELPRIIPVSTKTVTSTIDTTAVSSNNQKSNRQQLIKIAIALIIVLLALDYAWLKYQAHNRNQKPQPNLQNSPFR